MNNRKLMTLLRVAYCTSLAIAAMIVVFYETHILTAGTRAYDSQSNYKAEMIGVVLTIVAIPLALKLMSFKKVKALVYQQPKKYLKVSAFRIALLALTLIYNVLTYYLQGFDATLGYLALMVVVAFLFIWPSEGKMEYECGSTLNSDEK